MAELTGIYLAICLFIGALSLPIFILVFIGWGLIELVNEFSREPPGKGIIFISSPITEIIARSIKGDIKSYPTQIRPVPHPEKEEKAGEYTDLVRL